MTKILLNGEEYDYGDLEIKPTADIRNLCEVVGKNPRRKRENVKLEGERLHSASIIVNNSNVSVKAGSKVLISGYHEYYGNIPPKISPSADESGGTFLLKDIKLEATELIEGTASFSIDGSRTNNKQNVKIPMVPGEGSFFTINAFNDKKSVLKFNANNPPDTIEVDIGTGDCDLDIAELDVRNVYVYVKNGNVNLNVKTCKRLENIYVVVTNGNINFNVDSKLTYHANVDLTTKVGDISLMLNNTPTTLLFVPQVSVNFNVETVNMKWCSKNVYKNHDDESYRISMSVKTGSGDVNIK